MIYEAINKVEKRLELNFRGLKEFISLISDYYSVLTISNEFLLIGINNFKTNILNQYIKSIFNFIDKDDIIIQLINLKEKYKKKE